MFTGQRKTTPTKHYLLSKKAKALLHYLYTMLSLVSCDTVFIIDSVIIVGTWLLQIAFLKHLHIPRCEQIARIDYTYWIGKQSHHVSKCESFHVYISISRDNLQTKWVKVILPTKLPNYSFVEPMYHYLQSILVQQRTILDLFFDIAITFTWFIKPAIIATNSTSSYWDQVMKGKRWHMLSASINQ